MEESPSGNQVTEAPAAAHGEAPPATSTSEAPEHTAPPLLPEHVHTAREAFRQVDHVLSRSVPHFGGALGDVVNGPDGAAVSLSLTTRQVQIIRHALHHARERL